MSSAGVIAGGGVGGGSGISGVGGGAGVGAGSSQAISPSRGAEGVSDDGGKNSIAIGDNNNIGNTQTQNVSVTNNFEMNTNDFCTLHNASSGQEGNSIQGIGEMSLEDIQKMLMIMMIMKMLQAFMEDSGGGQQGGGLSAAM